MLFPNIVPVAELDHYAIASVYEIPVVSARAAFWREKTFERDDYSWHRKSAHPKDVWHQRLACLMYVILCWILFHLIKWQLMLNHKPLLL